MLQESTNEFPTPTNISFDTQKNPITVNNGFFTVCTERRDQAADEALHARRSTDIAGTGYEDVGSGIPIPAGMPGGSTGWLTTTAPVTPGEDVTLHFIIFDEGDRILDSAVLIDNFQWGATR